MMGYRAERLAVAALLAVTALASSCKTAHEDLDPEDFTRFDYARSVLGEVARITVYAEESRAADAAARDAFRAMARVEQIGSNISTISEVETMNGLAGQGSRIPVSDELFDMLRITVEVAENSEGAFDPTVGPLHVVWDRSRRSGRLPHPEVVDRVLGLVGHEKVDLDTRRKTVFLQERGMRVDLRSVIRGYAADRGLRVLAQRGLPMARVELDGIVVVGEAPPGKTAWTVPMPLAGSPASTELQMRWQGVASAGDDELPIVIDGTAYSDQIDPRTGLGLTDFSIATIVASSGAYADAIASAARALGPDRGEELAAAFQARAWVARPE